MENAIEFLRKFRQESQNVREAIADDPEVEQVLSMSLGEFRKQDLAILVRSYLLGEDIYLISNEKCLNRIDGKYVTYLPEELRIIYGLSSKGLKNIHRLKKLFDGEIIPEEMYQSGKSNTCQN